VRWAVFAAAAALVITAFAPAAGAAKPPIVGSVQCSVTGAALTFDPPLQNPETAATASLALLTGNVGSCVGPGNTPAPGGIHHGVLTGRRRIHPATCNELDRDLRPNVKVAWYDAAGNALGKTVARQMAVQIVQPGFYDPWTFRFSGFATPRSIAFAGEPVAMAFTTTSPNWAISANCGKVQLSGLSMVDGAALAIGP
jgi:hypothetical protein